MSAKDEELLARWKKEPASLLPILHAFHERDGYLSDDTVRVIAQATQMPLAELFGTITFYHHLARNPGGQKNPRVCDGPVCRLRGSKEILANLANSNAKPMSCPGRCDEPVPVLQGSEIFIADREGKMRSAGSPLPSSPPPGIEENVFSRLRNQGNALLAGYRQSGGYSGFERALRELNPGEIIRIVSESGLAGRGGAGFPTGRKWQAVADARRHPKAVICNADEGEPGCFKDRAIMDHDPHAVIEGMLAAALATGATRGFIYLRYEYPQTAEILARAIAEAKTEGLLGDKILGSSLDFHLFLRRGAGAYICGEETSLLNSLEGQHPFPRNRPPYPVTHGYENLPTVVNNVETLASIPGILLHGADWYRGLGLAENAGTKVISLSGDVIRTGNYEVPVGLPLGQLLSEWAGGPAEGRAIQAVTMAGLSGGFLAGDDLDVTLDEASIRAKGSFLGAGGIMVFDDSRDMIQVACSAMEFFADESCGKCFPCRIGTARLAERLDGGGPRELETWIHEVVDLNETMKQTSACGLGQAAPLIAEGLIRYFPDQLAQHIQRSS